MLVVVFLREHSIENRGKPRLRLQDLTAPAQHLVLISDGFPQDLDYGDDRQSHAYGIREFPTSSGLTVFTKGGLGATGYSPKGYDSVWLFSIGLGFGVEKPLNEKVSRGTL